MPEPKHLQPPLIKIGRTAGRFPGPRTPERPPAVELAVKQAVLRSLGITAMLSALTEGAFTLTPNAPLVERRAVLNLYSPAIVAGDGWAEFHSETPDAAVDVMFLHEGDAGRRYLLDLAFFDLGGNMTFTCRPALDRSGSGQTIVLPSGSNHVLFAVEVTSANSAVEIICDTDYQLHSCEITPLPLG